MKRYVTCAQHYTSHNLHFVHFRGMMSLSHIKEPTGAHLCYSHRLLAPYYCNVFRPSEYHLQGLRSVQVRPPVARASVQSGNSNTRNTKTEKLLYKVFYTFCIFSPQSWKLADSSEAGLNHKTFIDLLEADCVQRCVQKGHKCRWQSGNC